VSHRQQRFSLCRDFVICFSVQNVDIGVGLVDHIGVPLVVVGRIECRTRQCTSLLVGHYFD